MRFISISSQPIDFWEARLLKHSADRFGVNFEVTVDKRFDWEGWLAIETMKSLFAAMSRDEIVFFTDLWDTFLCCGAEEIERKFLAFGVPTVFSCEIASGPRPPKEGTYPASPTRWRYLNGGGCITRAGPFLDMITASDFRPAWAIWGQMAFSDWFSRHTDTMELDYHCHIFQTLLCCPPKALGSVDGRVRNWETGSQPCLVHGNGKQFGYLYHLWNGLGYVDSTQMPTQPQEAIDRATQARRGRRNWAATKRR